MPKHKVKLIVNPNADHGHAWRTASDLRYIVDEFGGADWSGTVYPTHATELARQAGEQGYEQVISVGGDGTAHEVVNGLMQVPAEIRPRLGIVPLGTGNDFAYSIGFDRHPYQALRQCLTGQTHSIDIGTLEDDRGRVEYWDNTLGVGFDTTVTIRSRRITFLRGFPLYFVAVIQTILLNHDAPLLRIKTDEDSWDEETLMMVLCNGPREGGGFLVAPDARSSDGVFHYAAIRRVSRAMMLRLVPEVMRGTHGRFRQVRMGQFRSLELTSDEPLAIHTDGEIFAAVGANVRRIKVELLPQALEVVS